jgi:hypothetical protein
MAASVLSFHDAELAQAVRDITAAIDRADGWPIRGGTMAVAKAKSRKRTTSTRGRKTTPRSTGARGAATKRTAAAGGTGLAAMRRQLAALTKRVDALTARVGGEVLHE